MMSRDVEQLMALYPRIYFACHTRHVRDERSGQVLTAHQASILDHLDERDAVVVGELAAHMGVTAGTMSIHVERLVGKGYVSRQRSEADGRQVELRLTEAGVRVRDEKSVLDPELVERMLSHLTPIERRGAIRWLGVLADAAAASMASGAGRPRSGTGG